MTIVIILLIAYFIINTFVYRFQRTTLSISRDIIGYGNLNMQALLTANWIGLLGWINTCLWIILCPLLFIKLGWLFAIIFLLYVFIGTSFIDTITPLPSYNQCFEIIKKSLNKDILKTSGEEEKTMLTNLLDEVIKIQFSTLSLNKESETVNNIDESDSGSSKEKIIIDCPNTNCQQQLALPKINSRLSVTCPSCKIEFFYPFETNTQKKVPPIKKNRTGKRWYHSNWFMVLMLLLLPVIGIILVWNNPRYRLQLKIGLTIAVVFLTISTSVKDANYMPSLPYEFYKFYEERNPSFLSIYLPKSLPSAMNIALEFEGPDKEEENVTEIFERAKNSVVTIRSIDKNNEIIGEGAGFVINENGVIVTNYHVLASAYSAEIKLANGVKHNVTSLLLEDKKKDICVIKIDSKQLPVLPLSDSKQIRVGEEIITIGNPRGYEMTVSSGIVSAIREDTDGIQITAPVSRGSSGGPLINKKGSVIGIVTSQDIFGQNINFAIPINHLVELITDNNADFIPPSTPDEKINFTPYDELPTTLPPRQIIQNRETPKIDP